MAKTLAPNYPGSPGNPKRKVPLRKTRESNVSGDLAPPYHVNHTTAFTEGVGHRFAKPDGGMMWVTCCGTRHTAMKTRQSEVTCLMCTTCEGCWVCKPGWIREETMFMGKWETKDGRRLYPFEMDSTHLVNSIKKLHRDKTHFKDDWQGWVKCLEVEAKQRGLSHE
jgi:hypothetical protein